VRCRIIQQAVGLEKSVSNFRRESRSAAQAKATRRAEKKQDFSVFFPPKAEF
jgi:hypothetical protein